MHRNMTWVVLAIAFYGLSASAQQPVSTSPAQAPQLTAPEPQRQQPPSGRPQGSNRKAPLTNADVVRMVKAGVPESAILSSIQSSPAKFDLSPEGLIGLRNAGVSQKVMEAMMAAGSVRRAAAPLKLGPAKTSSIVKNPRAAQAGAATIAVLAKQRQAAEQEASHMIKTGVHPAGLLGGPSRTMSSTGGSTAPNSGSAPAQRASSPAMISGSKGSGSSGNSSSSFAHAPQPLNAVLSCALDPTIRILNVSGEFSPATFTPDAKYNFYTITGCSFGDPGPNSKVYIYYQDIFHQNFQVQEWNDNGIKINLNPSLRGLLDQDNLTLVVQRADGKQATKNGFKFYAARDMTLLGRIPREAFSLNHFTLTNTSDLKVTYTSPSSPNDIPNISGYTAEVFWDCTDCGGKADSPGFAHYTQAGEDIYQFKKLRPGFEAMQAAMATTDISCQGQIHNEGNSGLEWVGDDLHVHWQGQTCLTSGCGGFGQPDCFVFSGSMYAVNVWVTGPRGVDPWTGKPY